MSLLSKLREKQASKIATATTATFATQEGARGRTVASVATVTVVKSPKGETAPPEKVGAGGTATASRWWLIHYLDRGPVEVACCPEATHAEILERHPGAVAAEPFTPTIRQPLSPMTACEEAAIRAWLALTKETDPEAIADVIQRCQSDADARAYFSGRTAAELPKPDPLPDDRRTCKQCTNLSSGVCIAAQRGEIMASPDYQPASDQLRRCEAYRPRPDDPDPRCGGERWPGLIVIAED